MAVWMSVSLQGYLSMTPEHVKNLWKKLLIQEWICQLFSSTELFGYYMAFGWWTLAKPFKVDIDNSGNLSFSEFLMLMVKTEGVEGVRAAFQVSHATFISLKSLLNFIDRN